MESKRFNRRFHVLYPFHPRDIVAKKNGVAESTSDFLLATVEHGARLNSRTVAAADPLFDLDVRRARP